MRRAFAAARQAVTSWTPESVVSDRHDRDDLDGTDLPTVVPDAPPRFTTIAGDDAPIAQDGHRGGSGSSR